MKKKTARVFDKSFLKKNVYVWFSVLRLQASKARHQAS